MREEPLSLKGAAVRALPRRNRTWSAGRKCAEPGCVTRLSIYNLGATCWQHADLVFPNYRGKRLAEGKA